MVIGTGNANSTNIRWQKANRHHERSVDGTNRERGGTGENSSQDGLGQKHIYNGILRQLLRRESTGNEESTSISSSRALSMEMAESVEPWIELVKKHQAAILSEAATFDMGHDSGVLGAMYNSIYNGALYRHTTSGDEKIATKIEMRKLFCHHSDLKSIYAPIFSMLATGGGKDFSPSESDCRMLARQ